MEDKIFSGITKEEAIRKACEELNVEKKNLVVEVLDQEDSKKTMYSILSKKRVKIKVQIKEREEQEITLQDLENAEKLIKNFFEELSKEPKFESLEYEVKIEGEALNVQLNFKNSNGKWIGTSGKNIKLFRDYIAAILRANELPALKVHLNIGDYKERQIEKLQRLAKKVESYVLETGKEVKLEPMTAFERKIIHDYIGNNDKLISSSVGETPDRKVVVKLKK